MPKYLVLTLTTEVKDESVCDAFIGACSELVTATCRAVGATGAVTGVIVEAPDLRAAIASQLVPMTEAKPQPKPTGPAFPSKGGDA